MSMHSDGAGQMIGNFLHVLFHAFCNKFYDVFLHYEHVIRME